MRRPVALSTALLPLVLAAAGCGLARQAPLAFVRGDYALSGQVLRQGRPVAGQLVKLYDQYETTLLDSLRTDADGDYGFPEVPAGGVMVKVSSAVSGDFGYVRTILLRADAAERDSVPPLDLFAYGLDLVSPGADTTVPTPSFTAPLDFAWTTMSTARDPRYKVRIADTRDSTVWESTREATASASFNGLGTFGAYTGLQVAPGTYTWRVKARLPFGVSAATRTRTIVFAGEPAGTAGP